MRLANQRLLVLIFACGLALPAMAAAQEQAMAGPDAYARAPGQAIDEAYTAQILKYTTDPAFNSPLTNYLPASSTVPTPEKILGHIAGAPDYLPYSSDVYKYFRALAAASPRVKVFTIGRSEEGREAIAVAVADEALLADLDANKARLAKLADPRTIGMNDATADELVAQSKPVYYITGTMHSPETGAPSALMELAYRLAVDDAPYIQRIRRNVITLITPVVEVDGRDRKVDVYNWHLANPGKTYPPLLYWGHYVAHDNNRDAMAMSLHLTRYVADTFIGWHAQVLHDLHESVPFLYDNTIGAGPYNAWIDPILTGEWRQLGWSNMQELTKFGMPGAFAHGVFDTWSPGYMMFIAATHNGISRLYETFGNDGADTVKRILNPDQYSRTWYRSNPPLPEVMWSQRNNNNYEQTGLLTTLNYFAGNTPMFLKNFYLKAKRSIEKPANAGPAAYVLSAADARKGAQSQLLRVMQRQHVEIQRTTAPVTVKVATSSGSRPMAGTTQTFPAGSWVVRMDQPYSRIADTLLDRQYWAPEDPQKTPFDDTGWSMGDLFHVELARVTDPAILKAPMTPVEGAIAVPDGLASIDVPAAKLPRIALLHTWLGTQTEGWWRMALDEMKIPFDYVSTQDVAKTANLRAKYDVILFAPVSGVARQQVTTSMIIDGLPMYGSAIPWKKTALTPNLGRIASTDDIRPGLGLAGLANLRKFVADGGLLVTSENTAKFAIETGMAPGVFVTPTEKLKIIGSVLQAHFVDRASPIAAGYTGDDLAVFSFRGQSFTVSNQVHGDRGVPTVEDYKRPTGRGGPDDVDIPEGRPYAAPAALAEAKPWEPLPLNVEQERNSLWLIPPGDRPQVILRYAEAKKLLLSGLIEGAGEMAERAAVVRARYGKGNVLLFATNPIWRGETIGSYPLVFNAILNFDQLDAGSARP